MIDFGK